MPAKDYRLCVSALTPTVYISKISKKDAGVMLDDRVVVPEQEFMAAIVAYTMNKLDKDSRVLQIKKGGELEAEIHMKGQPSHFDTFMATKHPKLLYHEIASGYFIAKGAGGLCGMFLFLGTPLTPVELNHYQQYGYLAKNVKTVAEAAIAIEEYLK